MLFPGATHVETSMLFKILRRAMLFKVTLVFMMVAGLVGYAVLLFDI